MWQRYVTDHYKNCLVLKIKFIFVLYCLTLALCMIFSVSQAYKPRALAAFLLGSFIALKCKSVQS